MSKFDGIVDEILEFFWKSFPISASLDGVHKYDHELGNVSRDYLEDINKKTKNYLGLVSKIKPNELSADEYLDWRLLKNNLEYDIMVYEDIRHWEKNPSNYINACMYGLFLLILREYAPIDERAEAFLKRLEKVPAYINQAQKNLKGSPAIFTELAIAVTRGGQQFFESFVPKVAAMVPNLKADLEKASVAALKSFENFSNFLKNDYLPKSRGQYAIGRESFDFILKKNHMVPYDTDAILAIGHETKEFTEGELKTIAKTIDPDRAWWEIIDHIKDDHPEPAHLLAAYQKEMMAAKKFIMEKDLVTMPVGEELEIIPTPPFSRPTIPYAAYVPPAPFEEQQKGFFYVTTIDEGLPVKEQTEILRGHSIYSIPITALHEGYPGHHLQLVLANRVQRKLRKIFESSVFVEGWALYCEEMMYDTGFYSDPRTRLFKLKDQLWRACRVIIDVGLHTGTMSYVQAVDLLVNDAKLERVHAEQEVTRYTYTPTQPLSYIIGKKQIIELKKDCEKKLKENFKLKDFHDKLLSFGTIPVVLVREAMGL